MPASVLPRDENDRENAGVFALLSRMWAREMDRDSLVALARPPLATEWQALGGIVIQEIDENCLEELAVDYCQLLIGPQGHVSPVQLVWDQKRFSGDATGSMQKYLNLLNGFVPAIEMVDHVAVQLQFAGALTGLSAESGRPLLRGLVTAFARDHLDWTYEFFRRTENQARTGFYKGLSVVSRRFLFGETD